MSVLGLMESIFLKFCRIWVLPVAEIWRRGLEPIWFLEHITRSLEHTPREGLERFRQSWSLKRRTRGRHHRFSKILFGEELASFEPK